MTRMPRAAFRPPHTFLAASFPVPPSPTTLVSNHASLTVPAPDHRHRHMRPRSTHTCRQEGTAEETLGEASRSMQRELSIVVASWG